MVSSNMRYYIYTPKEISILGLVYFVSSLLFLTLGLHLGKTTRFSNTTTQLDSINLVETAADKLPTEQEFFDNKDAFDNDLFKLISTELSKAVESNELHLKKMHQLVLPSETKTEHHKEVPQEKIPDTLPPQNLQTPQESKPSPADETSKPEANKTPPLPVAAEKASPAASTPESTPESPPPVETFSTIEKGH
jgi:hypothetical protein